MKEEKQNWRGDLTPFKHGEEGTHFACNAQMKKYEGKTRCCGCNGHDCQADEVDQIRAKAESGKNNGQR